MYHKMEAQSTICTFWGYAPNNSCYLCLVMQSYKFFTSRNVVFVKAKFHFHKLSLKQSYVFCALSPLSFVPNVPQQWFGASNGFCSHPLHQVSFLTNDNDMHSTTSHGSSHSSMPTHMLMFVYMHVHMPMLVPMHIPKSAHMHVYMIVPMHMPVSALVIVPMLMTILMLVHAPMLFIFPCETSTLYSYNSYQIQV